MSGIMQEFPAKAGAQATLANWRTRPFNQWAFHHVREIVPSANIPNAEGGGTPLPQGDADLSGIDFVGFAEETESDGLIVLRHGEIIHESYYGGMSHRTPHILMSVSKSMLGLLCGILEGRGLLDLSAPVTTYIPELAPTAFNGATVRNLLDMRAGVFFDEDYLATSGPIIEYRKATNWNPLGPGEEASDLRGFFLTLTESTGAHGEAFDYTSPCTDLLGWVIERATGRAYADVFSEAFWQPLGAEAPAYITVDRLGAPRCAGGVCMTLRDLARVGWMVAEGGQGVVPEAFIRDLIDGGDPEAWDAGNFAPEFPGVPMHYRSKWYCLRDEGPILMCLGIHGQNLLVDAKAGLVVAKMASAALPLELSGDRAAIRLFRMVRDRLK